MGSNTAAITGRQLTWAVRRDGHREAGVYAVRCTATGLVKIGVSRDVAGRMRVLQAHSAPRLDLLLVIPGGHDVESKMHQRYADRRAHGEWFRLSAADLRELHREALAHELADLMGEAGDLTPAVEALLTAKSLHPADAMFTILGLLVENMEPWRAHPLIDRFLEATKR